MRKQIILWIVVVAVALAILVKRSVIAPRQRHESSELARVEANTASNSSTAAKDSRAGPATATPSALSRDQPSDESANRSVNQAMPLPDGLQASITASFPGYRVPDGKDITSGWTVDKQPGGPSFLCHGDFNGDGMEDVAIILIGEEWRLVIFQGNNQGQYRPAFVARPKNKEELGKYWKNQILSVPQQLLLRTVKKGETWAPEAGDQKWGELKVDSIELLAKPVPNSDFKALIVFEEGKYQQVFLDLLVELPANAP